VVGPGPPFFRRDWVEESPVKSEQETEERELEALQEKIEQRLERLDPAIEVIAVERPAAETLRLYVDHPEGVDLGLCERVTNELRDLLEAWSLEVSSPGADRLLTKPEHFRRFVGRRVRVRTRDAIAGRRNFTGTLAGADESAVRLEEGTEAVTIPLAGIRRTNLVPDFGDLEVAR
jgi:ribosome maturation factor RimP